MPLETIAFWVAAVWLVATLFRSRPSASPTGDEGPETLGEILARRFALGEIDDDEYHRRLETLRSAGHPEARP